MDYSPLNLSELPADVIRKILGIGLEHVGTMQLISRRWNSVALEYCRHLSAIQCINWERYYFNSEATRLSVTLDKRFRNYLGFKNWAICDGKYDGNNGKYIVELTQDNWLNEATPCNMLFQIFQRCGSVKRFEIANSGLFPLQWIDNSKIQMIADANPRVKVLAFTEIRNFHAEQEILTLNLIRAFSPTRVIFHNGYDQIKQALETPENTTAAFIHNAANLVAEMLLIHNHYNINKQYWESLALRLAEQCGVIVECAFAVSSVASHWNDIIFRIRKRE